jgi:hypothetical protein
MSKNPWKQKLRAAKDLIHRRNEQELFDYHAGVERAQLEGDHELVRQLNEEYAAAQQEREIEVTGKAKKPEIVDTELYEKNKKSNRKRRTRQYDWADGGREMARAMRVSRKRSMESPVAQLGTLAIVSRDIDRFEFGYDGAERTLRKGEVVMPIGDVYFSPFGDKKVVDVMSGSQIFKGLPIGTLRPVDEV